jgi:serine/threonine protein kinase
MNQASIHDECGSLSDQQQIEVIAERFEKEWVSGNRGNLDRFVRISPPGLRVPLFRELLLIDLVYRRRLGEAPSMEEYARRFPRHAAVVADIFEPQNRRSATGDDGPSVVADRYQLEEPIGKGSFGVVYRATDLELGRTVAIKLRRSDTPASENRFQNWVEEARLAAKLEHPGIVSVIDAGTQDDGTSYLVLQYIAGKTLKEHLRAEQPLPVSVSELFASVADALAYAHRRGCVHRDLKPDNILIDDDGVPHIVDFGLAIHDEDRPGLAGEVAGSPIYMCPEQVRGESHRLDGRSDIWALGVMIYESLVGRPPFQAKHLDDLADEILHRSPKPPRQIQPSISRDLEKIALKCLAKDPNQRYATAGDVANLLRQSGNRSKRRRWMFLVGSGTMATVLGGAWLSRKRSVESADNTAHVRNQSQLDLLLWRDDDWVSLADSTVRAIHFDDQVRLHVKLSSAAYAYLIWIDAAGQIAPIYPFVRGDWSAVGKQRAVRSLQLPEGEADSVWTVEGSTEGVETVMLGVRSDPHTDPAFLQDMELPHELLQGSKLPGAWWFRDGQLERRPHDRKIDPIKVVQLNHAVLKWHQVIYERLESEFDELLTVSFPFRGK